MSKQLLKLLDEFLSKNQHWISCRNIMISVLKQYGVRSAIELAVLEDSLFKQMKGVGQVTYQALVEFRDYVKDNVESSDRKLYTSLAEVRAKYTTISPNASTRLTNNLLRLGIDSIDKVKDMTDEQVLCIHGHAQTKLLGIYREYLSKQ